MTSPIYIIDLAKYRGMFIKAPKKIIHGVYLVIVAFVTLIIYIALKDDINAVFVSLLDSVVL